MDPGNFFAELKRRNVYKVAVAYGVIAWLLIQAASILFPTFEAPSWVMKVFVVILATGFIIALLIAWAFEMTPQGMKRTEDVSPDEKIPQWSRRKFAAVITLVALGAAVLLALQLLRSKPSQKPNDVATIPPKSIAVLPFENLSEEKANAYFAEGIQDEILTRLSKIADLKVISRTSTQKYKSAPDNLREIAHQLGVANILEGSVQKSGEQVRITVQLINALKDDHLWADTYDRKMIDVFGVETDVAQKIATSLEAKLTGREKKELAFAGTRNPQAYDALLHALALRGSQQLEDADKQREFLQRAVDLDPNYAEAWAFLGGTNALTYFSTDSSAERKEKARTEVETAVRLAPDLGEVHTGVGMYKYYCLQDYDGALAEFGQVLQHAPNDSIALYFTALVERRQGKFDESIRVMKQAAVLDPLNEDIQVNLGQTYRGLRRFDDARGAFDRALTIAPEDTGRRYLIAETYLAQGDADKAWKLVQDVKISRLDPSFGTYMNLLAARRQFDEMIGALSSAANTQGIPPLFRTIMHTVLANVYLVKGDRANAVRFRTLAEEEFKPLQNQERLNPFAYGVFIQMEARFGDRAAVDRNLKALYDQTQKDRWVFPLAEVDAAVAYMLLGDSDRTFPLLESALSKPSADSITPALLRLDPVWDPIRNDPRFQKLANAKP